MLNRVVYFSLCLSMFNVTASEKFTFSTGLETIEQNISIQVLQEAYQKIGLTTAVLRFPNLRSLVTANSGYVDGEVSRISQINQRFKNLLQVPVVINYIEGYVFASRNTIPIKDWASLRGYKLVCVRGLLFVEQNLSLRSMPCAHVTRFSQAVNLLQKKRFDATVFPKLTGLKIIQDLQLNGVFMLDAQLIKVDLFHYLHKKHKAFLPSITATLRVMEESGRIAAIREEFITNNNLNGS
ncbi:transporter substrate-binding domain-containing protein [Alteromonadaceae bacterium BrNp21-10]|nr:transporter substrate-binding domain-containing protein [Alteromonadaceae bacterium BrNp21-10]